MPSNDPNDPLNWLTAQKYYLLALVSSGIFLVNFVAVGPSVVLPSIAISFFGAGPNLATDISSKASYFQTAASLMIGVGNLIWVPLATKYAKRHCGVAKSFGSELAARIVLGTACGAPEIVAPLTLADIFFLHQRGTVMVIYTCALSCGVGAGVVISGLIRMHHTWRDIYWLCTALIGFTTVLALFTFPETSYKRRAPIDELDASDVKGAESNVEAAAPTLPTKKTFVQDLRLFSGTYTDESFFMLMGRPIVALALPAVFWATLINSVTIGVIVVVSANFATAFSTIYGCHFMGGHLSDYIADRLTVRNGGVRSPEMRLPALVMSLITGPLACILYGVGCGKRLPWICAVFGIGLVNFPTVQSSNIGLVYTLDSYRPIAGEVIVTQSVFKAIFGFLLSFYVDTWINQSGYIHVFGTLAGISAAVFICVFPFYFWGRELRHMTWQWGFVRKLPHWNPDREVGE